MPFETMFQQRTTQTAPGVFAELSVVAMLREVRTDDGAPVPAGTEGTVVAVYGDGAAYEVEFDEPVVGTAKVTPDALRAA